MPEKSFVDNFFTIIVVLTILVSFFAGVIYTTMSNADTRETITTHNTLVLRPNGDSGTNQWVTSDGGVNHYSYVDEAVSDDDTTYLKRNTGGHWAFEYFDMEDHTDEDGTIVNVTLYAVAKKLNDTSVVMGFKLADDRNLAYVKSTDAQQVTTEWATYSWSFALDWNDTEWTWAKVDNMSSGLLGEKVDLNFTMVTQDYAVVNYDTYAQTGSEAPAIYSLLVLIIFITILGCVSYAWKNLFKKV